MNDTILEQLGRAEREAQQIPERWLRLSRGEASAEEIAELEAEAARDPEAAALYEMFRPLDSAQDDALTQTLLTRIDAESRMRWNPMAMVAFVGTAAAAAAALGLWSTATPQLLPVYGLEASTSDLGYRGHEAVTVTKTLPRHHPDSSLTLVLRPEAPVLESVAAQAFLLDANGARELSVSLQQSSSGAVRLDGRVRDLVGTQQGVMTVILVVRPETQAPISSDDLSNARKRQEPPSGTRWADYEMVVARD